MEHARFLPFFPPFTALANGALFVVAVVAFLNNEDDSGTWAIVAAITLGSHYVARTVSLHSQRMAEADDVPGLPRTPKESVPVDPG